jgi:hypothetical protein
MPDVIRLSGLIKRYEAIYEALRGYAVLGTLHLSRIQGKYLLRAYLRVLGELAARGFDEVLCYRVGEALEGLSLGWLPVEGEDFRRALSAFKAAGADVLDYKVMEWWKQPHLGIYEYEGDIYVEVPVQPAFDHRLTLVRLDDGELGDKFTEGLDIRELGEGELEALRAETYEYVDKAREIFMTMSPEDYLRLANRVNHYAAKIYSDFDYPLQVLEPYIEEGCSHILLMGARAAWSRRYYALGRRKGDISQYDPSYVYVTTLHRGWATRFDEALERFEETWREAIDRLRWAGRPIYTASEEREGPEFVGAELYSLDTDAAADVLTELFGEVRYRVFREIIMPRLGEGLYLLIVGTGGRGLYEIGLPPPSFIPTALLAKALYLEGEIVEAVFPEVVEAGAPEYLLTIESDWTREARDRWMKYSLAVSPRSIELRDGIFYDRQTGAGVAALGVEELLKR